MKKKNGENACFISISASQKSYVRNRTTSRAQPHKKRALEDSNPRPFGP